MANMNQHSFVLLLRYRVVPTAPFAKVDSPIVVSVDIVEESVQSCWFHCHAGLFESRRQLSLVQAPTTVLVYGLEELPELLFRFGTESAKLIIADVAIVVNITRSEHVLDERVCIFESCNSPSAHSYVLLRLPGPRCSLR